MGRSSALIVYAILARVKRNVMGLSFFSGLSWSGWNGGWGPVDFFLGLGFWVWVWVFGFWIFGFWFVSQPECVSGFFDV